VEGDVFVHVIKVGRGELDHTQLQYEGRLANSLEPWGECILSAGIGGPASRCDTPLDAARTRQLGSRDLRHPERPLARGGRAHRRHALGAELRPDGPTDPASSLVSRV
jgi:hypothetical protein